MSHQPTIVAGIGELLWDVLPHGEQLGGAPINFAYHATALGARGLPISTVGVDRRGTAALDFLSQRGLTIDTISRAEDYPTGYVVADLDDAGVAHYHFPADVAWDHLFLNDAATAAIPRLQAVCFGTLAQRSTRSQTVIQTFLRDMPDAARRVYDINVRQDFYSRSLIETSLTNSSIVKLNDDELALLRSMFNLAGTDREQLAALRTAFTLEMVILTKGGAGSILLTEHECSEHPGIRTNVVDTIGAGDSFTAAVVIGLLHERPLDAINERANQLAAYVCSHAGAMPAIPDRFRSA